MITLLETTSHNSESFKSFVKGLENCKLNTFEHWNYFLSYSLLFTPQRVWERGGIYTSIINKTYDSRGANVKIVKLLNRRDCLDSGLSISSVKVELDEKSGKLILSGDAGYYYSGVLCSGTYRVEISFVEEMWTDDGHFYLGGKIIPITQDMLGY